jgi:outer membrane protein insertion porin family
MTWPGSSAHENRGKDLNYRNILRPIAWLLVANCLAWPMNAAADESFVVEDIALEGLQRIPDGTLFNYLPINIGDELDSARVAQGIRALYATGFFHDIEFRREGSTLVIIVEERPTIALFQLSGNKEIPDEDLRRVLREVGLTEGRIFNRSVLEGVETELQRQYFARGRYGMEVERTVTELPSNTVAVSLVIREGLVARIREIAFVGNEAFSDSELLGEFELRTRNWLSWFRGDDQYSREKLQGDLETLRSYYMDRGYAAFGVRSTQVAISPDKKEVYITINIEEGEPYRIGEVTLSGNLVVPEEVMRQFLVVEPGSTFSLAAVTQSTEWMVLRLGEEGYAYAEVTPIPDIDDETRTVDLNLFVQPGSRVYVRRIEFGGSNLTDDETYRREMRQLEGSWLQSGAIERSRTRLQRLPFVENVEIDTTPVPGAEDLVDVDVEVTERNPGDFNFGIGYSSAHGALINAGLTHSNFLGRGLRTQIQASRSRFEDNYAFSYTDPYLTTNGVSGRATVFYRSLDSLFVRSSPFLMNTYGGSFEFGIPISEFNRFNIGFAVQDTEIIATQLSATQLRDWTQNPNHGDIFTLPDPLDPTATIGWGTNFRTFELLAGFVTDTRNRSIFATSGHRRQYSVEVTIPPSDVEYVMANFINESYFPLPRDFTLSARGGIRLGHALGDTTAIPPYKHFYGGGPDSVRGYREAWLGPRDSFDRPYGGNIMMFSQVELILPTLFEAMRDKSQISLFYDVGNVFNGRSNVSFDELRMSAGVSLTWLAPIGAMKISVAFPFRQQPGDETERIQFSVGSAF